MQSETVGESDESIRRDRRIGGAQMKTLQEVRDSFEKKMKKAYRSDGGAWCYVGLEDLYAMNDAIKLLEEQKAVEPKVSCSEQRCGNCNKVIEMDGWVACPWCGKPIDWERWCRKNGTRN